MKNSDASALGNLPPLLSCYSSLILNSYLLSLFNSGSCISRNTSGWIQFNKYLRSTCLGARTSGSSNVKTYPRNSQSTEGNTHMKRSSVSLVVRIECYETQRREWWLILPHGGGLDRNQMKEKGHFWKRTWHKGQWGIKTSLLWMEYKKTHWEKPRLRTYQRLCPGPKTYHRLCLLHNYSSWEKNITSLLHLSEL